jgi:hypothetical protein
VNAFCSRTELLRIKLPLVRGVSGKKPVHFAEYESALKLKNSTILIYKNSIVLFKNNWQTTVLLATASKIRI